MRAGDDQRADPQRAALHEHGRNWSAAAVEPRLDDRAFGAAIGIGDQVEQFGLQRDRLEQLVEIGVLGRRNLDRERIAAERLDLHVVLQKLLHHPLRIGLRLVDLVDGDDDRRLGRLGVANRLDRLRHDAVVGGDDQHDDVGDLRAARAHGGEGGVAGRVDEGDRLAAGRDDLIGADVLGDAAGFARHDIGVADRVEQRGLAVIDMAHDGDDRRTRHGRAFFVGPIEQAFLDVGFGDALDRMPHFLGDELRGVGVEHVGQGHHAALAHQELDHVDRALGHAAREFLDGDRLRQHDLARDLLFLILRAVALQPLGAAAERGDRARALLLARGRAGDGQAAAVALLAAARRARRRHDDLLPRQDQRRAPDDALRFVLLAAARARERSGRQRSAGRGRGYARDRRGRRGFAAGQTPSRLVLRLALEIGFLGAAKLFVALARLGGLAFKAIARLALAPSLGVRLLAAAVLLLPRARVDERPGARLALLGGQGGQHHAGLGRRRSGRLRRRGGGRPRRAGENRLGRRGAAWAGAGAGAGRAATPTGGASPGVKMRRFTFSTTTALVRPCEKLCRTVPCSTGRFRCNVVFGGGAPKDLSLLFVSLMPIPNRLAFQPIHRPAKRSGLIGRRAAALCPGCRVRFAFAIAAQTLRPREKGRTRRALFERSMYHICPPQCQIQLPRREEFDAGDGFGRRAEPGGEAWARLAAPSGAPSLA